LVAGATGGVAVKISHSFGFKVNKLIGSIIILHLFYCL
jgi:hypothetical protein